MMMELLPADLDAAKAMCDVLTTAAGVDGVTEVMIRFRLEGGDRITVGFGPMAEPAIIEIEPMEDKHALS